MIPKNPYSDDPYKDVCGVYHCGPEASQRRRARVTEALLAHERAVAQTAVDALHTVVRLCNYKGWTKDEIATPAEEALMLIEAARWRP